MKKLIYLMILLFGMLVVPNNVFATTYHREYGISDYRMDITVLANGDLHVVEMFQMTGDYNGMERIINYKSNYTSIYGNSLSPTGSSTIYNGSGIKLNNIKGVTFSKTTDLKDITGDLFDQVNSASKGDYGIYTVTKSSNGETYLIYNPDKKNKAFYIDYILEGMGVIHNDIAEVGLNLFTEMNESIGNLEVYIHIPDNKDELRVWAHGPLYGNSTIIDKNTLKITIGDLDASTAIDVRFIFDKNVINGATKTTNINALDKIITIETDLANKANEEREAYYRELQGEATMAVSQVEKSLNRNDYEYAYSLVLNLRDDDSLKEELQNRLEVVLNKISAKEKRQQIISHVVLAAYLIGLGVIIYHVYHKHDKEYKKQFESGYYRDFPSEDAPSTVGFLIRSNVNNDDLSAEILDLIRKKKISFEPLDNKNKDFTFTKLDETNLTNAEEKLMEFLFSSSDKKVITLGEIKRKSKSNYDGFITNYTAWKNISEHNAKSKNFFEDKGNVKFLSVLYAILGIIISSIISDKMYPIQYITIFVCILSGIYFIGIKKRSKEGNEQYIKWMSLKNFMLDFGKMDDKDLPDVVLWEKYLVYALTLGCADKLAKSMEIKVKELEQAGTVMPSMFDIYYMHRLVTFNRILNNTVNQSIQSAYSARSAANASSNHSSGGGFGGGFSGGSFGGGSFGGGGGGGRF